jgi:hypothetical protein
MEGWTMALRDPANNGMLYVEIPQELRDALDARCRETGRKRTRELVLALKRHLETPADAPVGRLPERGGEPVVLYGELRADLLAAVRARASAALRPLKAEVVLALERHLARPAEPLPPKPEVPKRPRGRPRKSSQRHSG